MRAIKKVLIANRGEIAGRILRSLDRLAIRAAVIYHRLDADSPAVRAAAEAVEIDAHTPVDAYLDMEQIIAVCKQIDADALHPGFGFLAENAGFAERLREEGIRFIGPLPKTTRLMGDKVAARTFCIENSFPLLPSVTESDTGDDFVARVREIGPPVLIKAAAGGGGKGMHIVRDLKYLQQAVQLSKAEALRSFGNGAIYAERYVEKPRHIEVQVLADHHGNVIHLGERECSIQRRFQKIIEESPAVGIAPALREKICSMAVEIARKAGYRNAGTVEFILTPDNDFFFLEMNTRLQVEHPVTEMVTGVDLVELQVRIARGEPLPLAQGQICANGHAIELRLYAEDPENDFLPATGTLLAYDLPAGNRIRVDNGYAAGMQVTSAFDPMLAKLIVHGQNRVEATHRALKALDDTLVLGVSTNADFLARILLHPAYAKGRLHTAFIPLHEKDLQAPPLSAAQRDLLLAAAAMSSRELTDPAFTLPEPYASMGSWRN